MESKSEKVAALIDKALAAVRNAPCDDTTASTLGWYCERIDSAHRREVDELRTCLREVLEVVDFTAKKLGVLDSVKSRAEYKRWCTALESTQDVKDDCVQGRSPCDGIRQPDPRKGRTGTQDPRGTDTPAQLTCGTGPYTADIVKIRNEERIAIVGTRYKSEGAAVQAIIKHARVLGHPCSDYTRHWITKKNEHIIDYGSHAFYGRITSNKKDK